MVAKYTLQPDEWVVMESEPGARHVVQSGSPWQQRSNSFLTIVLTNQNIILVSTARSGKAKGTKYFPLNQINVADGHPQIFATSRSGSNHLEIHFQSGEETFAFRRKKELNAWAENIAKLLAGDDDFSTSKDKAIPGVAYLAGSLKDTFGAVKSSLGLEPTAGSDKVAGKCGACGAPLTGRVGAVIRCRYCDSDQQL